MHKKKIRMLGFLAVGIYVELMLMSFFLGTTYGQSKSSIKLASKIVIPQGEQANVSEQAFLYENAGPAPLDEDHPLGSMPSDSDFIPTDVLLEGTVQPDEMQDTGAYPAPVYDGSGGDGSGGGGDSYPAPDEQYDPIFTPSMPPISSLQTETPPVEATPTLTLTPVPPTAAPTAQPTSRIVAMSFCEPRSCIGRFVFLRPLGLRLRTVRPYLHPIHATHQLAAN